MEKDLLQAVIRVESEIQQSIESEKKKAAEWLESARVSIRGELTVQKLQLDEEYTRSLEATCNECELQAKKDIADVKRMTEHLHNLPEELLQEVVKEFLIEILPGEQE